MAIIYGSSKSTKRGSYSLIFNVQEHSISLFGAFPIVYQVNRKWSEVSRGSTFLGGALGLLCASAFSFWTNKQYNRIARKSGGIAPAEARLIPAMYTAKAIPVGLFWFAWTNDPSMPWIISVAATVLFGFGLLVTFLSVTSYRIDSYVGVCGVSLAANAVLRSLFGAAFSPSRPTCIRLSVSTGQARFQHSSLWQASPFHSFSKYGAGIRKRCAYASQADAMMANFRAEALRDIGPAADA